MLLVLISSNSCNQNIQKNAKVTIYYRNSQTFRENKGFSVYSLVFSLWPIQCKGHIITICFLKKAVFRVIEFLFYVRLLAQTSTHYQYLYRFCLRLIISYGGTRKLFLEVKNNFPSISYYFHIPKFFLIFFSSHWKK